MTKILRHRLVSAYMKEKNNHYGNIPELAYFLLNAVLEFMNKSQNNISTNGVISFVKNINIADEYLSSYAQLLDTQKNHPDHWVKTGEQFHELIVAYLIREISQKESDVLKKKRSNTYFDLFRKS